MSYRVSESRVPPASAVAWLAAIGAVYAAAGIALSAYAAHVVAGADASRLQAAGLFAFGNGIALAALAPVAAGRLNRIALIAIAVGTLLFSGSLVARVVLHATAMLAPFGGMLMIGGWLLYAIGQWRR